MSMEAISVTGILIFCWMILAIIDAAVSGIIAYVSSIPFRKAFLWGLTTFIIPPMLMIYGAIFDRNNFRINEIEIEFTDLPEGFDGYRIVHISDIHARSFEKRRKHLSKAIEMINASDPDLVAFTGDLVTMDADEIDSISDILTGISAKEGVISVLGNHDYCDPETVAAKEKDMGWNPLLNEHITIYSGKDSISIIGVENTSTSKHFPSRGNLEKASAGTEGMFRILLTHDPLHWDNEIIGKDFPLTLSGHTHAMQTSILGLSPSRLAFRRYRGLYHENHQKLYVNIGLGETIFPLRIGARPEITVLVLRKGEEI